MRLRFLFKDNSVNTLRFLLLVLINHLTDTHPQPLLSRPLKLKLFVSNSFIMFIYIAGCQFLAFFLRYWNFTSEYK